jgi:ubiquinone/menaquinone biosynthesis C-methylase UbiE
MAGRIYDATWGRIFSASYDRFMAATEKAGLRDERRRLLGQAMGRTIEIGAGTGLNLDHYPATVTELVLTEPDPKMAKRLRRRLDGSGRTAEVVEAPGERLPFPDNDFDTAVATLVLCTVPDQEATLREIARVLKPGGRFLFIEHVRSQDERLAKWQDRFHGAWKLFGDGCNCNRDTLAAIEASQLELAQVEHGAIPRAIPLVKPKIFGAASAPFSVSNELGASAA